MKTFLLLFASLLPLLAEPVLPQPLKNISYLEDDDDPYRQERCQLDLYLPGSKSFPTLIWLHGGGLKGGRKDGEADQAIARALAEDGIAVAMVNYRLSPRAKYPAYLEDTAAAVAWTKKEIARHGGDPNRIYLGGHSAGGYLALMVGMDARWLQAHQLVRSDLAGLIPVSGQTMTHYTVREERFGSDDPFSITADAAAPVHYASRSGIPPLLVLWADNDMPARAEENAYLVALLKGAGQTEITGLQIANRDHGSIAFEIANAGDPARAAINTFLTKTQSTTK
ncbi:alpha/beta hydrolase [Roseibacillus ishigakijimensis]|uniref:Alpha/beta hydrolase n=1 Tax=Roseibacillus ishigakijimensis TaxID=454146 RepID=A0A934VJK5_9BACT|nr:alpha/beta hydrolase [Roseibacillus ishigakijimensis]MBK1832699.1 alpha/beta hydrolase [Roseibacillus ishigakijimensis]